jgi:hypothetical protein
MKNLVEKTPRLKKKTVAILFDDSGSSVLSDHAGMTIAGIVLIAAIIVVALAWTKGTLLPTIWERILALFNYS